MSVRVGIGQDSHRFSKEQGDRKLVLAGVVIEGVPALEGNSDADVVLHSITNAVSGVTCVNILGDTSDRMCLEQGITDSSRYLEKALEYLEGSITHVSVSIECSRPRISPFIQQIRESLSQLLGVPSDSIGITATTGEGLTAFGQGDGIQVFSCITVCD